MTFTLFLEKNDRDNDGYPYRLPYIARNGKRCILRKFVELEKKTVIDNIETAINDKRSYAIERAMKPSVRASLQAYAHTAR